MSLLVESRDHVSALRSPLSSSVNRGVPRHRAREPSLVPDLADLAAVEIVLRGWLYKQGGAKGGRKSWKRRWFVLKEDCLYYKESPDSAAVLGVMGIAGCHILDLGILTQSAPPLLSETDTVCRECKKGFTFLNGKHHCRHCGHAFCNNDSLKRIAIPKFGLHSRVRVCDACYEQVATELESSEVVLKLLELTGEAPGQKRPSEAGAAGVGSKAPAIAAHVQAMSQLKQRSGLPPSATKRMGAFFSGGSPPPVSGVPPSPVRNQPAFTLPQINKPHLFALKNSERELWLHAENAETRLEWVQAIRGIQKRHMLALYPPPTPTAAAAAAATSSAASFDASPPPPVVAGPVWEIPFEAVSVLNKIGVGAFGEVYRARLWGTEVAMKTLRTELFADSDALLEELKKEVSILSQLRHPNVVLYIGACTTPPNVCILTEWCARGSLYDVLHDYSIHLNAKLVIDLAIGIAQGMSYLHSLSKKIIHRDLKSHNILVNKNFQVKVADFGLSHVRELQAKEEADGNAEGRVEHKGPRHYGIFGTPEWMAPEVMEGHVYTEKIDVYSFGILLSELATRHMPFHDRFPITCYMDVVDAVLDQGAIPTVPKWCHNLLGGLIHQCVSRVPEERPSFTDLILRLREVADLDDSHYFFQFDLPRLRELMMSPLPAIQSLAASEVAVLLTNPLIRRRSSPEELAEGEEPDPDSTPVPSASPASSISSPGMSPSPLSLGPASVMRSPPSARQTTEINVGGLTSPMETGAAYASNHMQQCGAAIPTRPASMSESGRVSGVEGAEWLLDNEDAFDFLERFTSLLTSSHREVQLHSCQALRSLLKLSEGDKAKRALDRELVISNGGISSLLTLLLSEQHALAASAGEVLLLLTGDLTSEEQKTFTGLNALGLSHLQGIMLRDIDKDTRAIAMMQRRIAHKKRVLEVIQTCAARGADSTASPIVLNKPRAPGKRSLNAVRFQVPPSMSSGGSPVFSPNPGPGGDSSDEDGAGRHRVRNIAQELIDATAAAADATMAAGAGLPSGGSPKANPPGAAVQTGPTTPALQALLDELLALQASPPAIPENFTEWYSPMRFHSHALRYELEGDTWRPCFLVLLQDELRLFNSVNDEPDEPLFILRTRVPPPRDAVDDTPQPAKVRVGHKHGLPHCFQLEDCGSIFTFCAGTADAQEEWRMLITGKPRVSVAAPAPPAPAVSAVAGQPVAPSAPQPPVSPTSALASTLALPSGYSAKRRSLSGSATAIAAAAAAHAYHAIAITVPVLPPEPDPTVGRDMPILELPTPPFSKRYRSISYHGYLVMRDRGSSSLMLKYVLLCGTSLRIFDSHRSSPHEPWAEHDIDPELTLSLSSGTSSLGERRAPPGPNQFYIRLHNSSVQFDVWAANAAEKEKWMMAIGEHAPQHPAHTHAGHPSHSSAGSAGMLASVAAPGSPAMPAASAGRIAAFAAYYGHIDYYGFLWRRRKLTSRWIRSWVLLVDSEVHYYSSPHDACDDPAGTFYISTHSGLPFEVRQSSKRPHCFAVVNPSRTFYLAADTEREYLGWTSAIHQNVKRLERMATARSQRKQATDRARFQTME